MSMTAEGKPFDASPAAPRSVRGESTIARPASEETPVRTLAPSLAGGQFGDYELLEEIARGGMGVVYRAKQQGLNRVVALKMILTGKLAGPQEVQRFHVEAKAAAQLHHPNIVAIYEVGEHGGQHFFSMEYVPGRSLASCLAGGPLPGKQAALLLEQVAQGVHYAHRKGILHRDLKPANILLDDNDRPKITDFGLAKVMAPEGAAPSIAGMTHTGMVMGTPSYMAPEQANGAIRDLGPLCDVYGLGAVLYELITGRPPFKAESHVETILQVLNQDPVPPRLINENLDADLETICLKCLEKDPALRYASAADLAADLHRYLTGESITARSFNLIDRVSRALTHSQHDKELRGWGTMLMLFALVIFLAHLTTSLLLIQQYSDFVSYWLPRVVQFALLGAVVWWSRPRMLIPTNSAERLIWAVWGGYLLAYAFASRIFDELGYDHLQTYPISLLLSGLAFFIMGCHVWGWCYVIGLVFMIVSPFMARYSDPARHAAAHWLPCWFGVMWGLALLTIGQRYWRMSRSSADSHEPQSTARPDENKSTT
jgi:serine/threonine protein kinase